MKRILRVAIAILAVLMSSVALAQGDTADARPGDLRLVPTRRLDEDFRDRKEEVRANIELWEGRVRKKVEQIDRILEDIDIRKIDGQQIAKRAISELLDDVDDEAKEILEAHTQVGPDLRLYRQALDKAPDVFREISNTLDRKATLTKSTLLKEAYADLATQARTLASSYEAKSKEIDGLEAGIVKKIEFVRESRVFIGDVRELLDAIPADHGLQTEKLVQRLNQYIQGFEEAVKAIKGVADKIGGEGRPATPDPNNAKPKPLSQIHDPLAPISIEEYRQRLAALKR